ncbi:MAG: DUF177 domain-containing protein [Polyangiaceae bacterium]
MTQPLFTVALRDLERSDQTRSWAIPVEWLVQAFEGTEGTPEGGAGQLELYLKKSEREVLVKGKARAKVVVPCARTLDPLPLELEAEVFLMLSPRAVPPAPKRERAPRAVERTPRAGDRAPRAGDRTPRAGDRPERAPRKRESAEDALDAELSSEDAARDHYEGETIVLDEFVREHLLLELPLFPVRSDLPSEEAGVTGSLPDPAGTDEPAELDPRLAPLAALRQGLVGKK